jgi:hypothetical protein
MIGTVTVKQREAQVIIEIVRSPPVPVVGRPVGGWDTICAVHLRL